jgi:hypothetical protein
MKIARIGCLAISIIGLLPAFLAIVVLHITTAIMLVANLRHIHCLVYCAASTSEPEKAGN